MATDAPVGRLRLLREGDQLPTVKEVVGALTINPNTEPAKLQKAQRQLGAAKYVSCIPLQQIDLKYK